MSLVLGLPMQPARPHQPCPLPIALHFITISVTPTTTMLEKLIPQQLLSFNLNMIYSQKHTFSHLYNEINFIQGFSKIAVILFFSHVI